MPTNIRVAESTGNVPASRAVRDVSRDIHYLDADAAPYVLMSKRAGRRPVSAKEFEWIEKQRPTEVDNVIGAQTNVDTAIEVDTPNAYFVDDLVMNMRTREIFRVTVGGTSPITVVRGVGSVAGTAMNDNDPLIIIGPSVQEGNTAGIERSVQEAFLTNYTQIFEHPFGTTGTEAAVDNYTGKDRPRLQREFATYHMQAIEKAFLLGQKNQDVSAPNNPRRYTGGFDYFIQLNGLNVVDAGGALSDPTVEDFARRLFENTGGGPTRVFFTASKVVAILNQLAAGRLQTVPRDEVYGISIKQWDSFFGSLFVVQHRLLKSAPDVSAFAGFGERLFGVDPKKLRYAALRTRDTKLEENVHNPGYDGWKDLYRTEAGFEIANPECHGILKTITS
jgi:hypothetical protein